MNDMLRQYVQTRSPEAFRQLVEAHVDAVYSQGLRELRDPAAAEEITQMVFVTLAQKAGTIRANAVLEGWLFTATRYCCANYRRASARRRSAERKAATMRKEALVSDTPDEDLQARTEEILDDALGNLSDRDRNAVLLRFFQGRSLREVGEELGVSEDAAKQRVFRAVEKMRNYFASRGVTVESASVIATLSSAVRPAGSHVAQSAIHAGMAKSVAVKAGLISTWPKIVAAIALVGALVGAIVIANHPASVQTAVQTLPPVAPPPTVADSNSTPAPAATTQPMPQDTPTNALIKFCTAMENNDRAGIEDCLYTAQTPQRPTMGFGLLEEVAATYHLQQIWQQKFGVAMSVPGYNFATLPKGTFEILRNMLETNSDGIKPNGDVATFIWPLGPDVMGGSSGPDRDASAERWAGAQMVMRRVDGNWKLDLDRTFDMLVTVQRKPGVTADAMQIADKLQSGLRDGFNDVAAQIDSGAIVNVADAVSAVQGVATQAFDAAGATGENDSLLPVVGGEALSPRNSGGISGIVSAIFGGNTASTESAATQPAPQGQETPINTLSKLCTAMEQNDQAALDDCICNDGVDPGYAALGRACIRFDAATFRIEKDWANTFGQSMAVSGLNFDMFPAGPFSTVLRGLLEDPNGPTVTTSGDEAQVRILLPPETFTGPGVNRFAPMERWSGAMLILRQTNGVWKLDTDRTFDFVVSVNRMKGNNDDAIDVSAKVESAIAGALNDVASKIEAGQLPTAQQARTAIATAIKATFKSAKVKGTNLTALPVVGGTP